MFAGKKKEGIPARGATLIEVCISVVILTLMFSSLMAVFSQGSRYLRKDRQRSVGMMLAYGILENLTAPPFNFSTPNQTKAAMVAPFARFQSSVNITNPASGGTLNELAEINVTVYWQGEQGERSVSVNTLVSDY